MADSHAYTLHVYKHIFSPSNLSRLSILHGMTELVCSSSNQLSQVRRLVAMLATM